MKTEEKKKIPATHLVVRARLAFPALFAPRPYGPVQKGVTTPPDKLFYQASLLLPPETPLQPIAEAMRVAMMAKFNETLKLTGDSQPVKKCDDMEKPPKGFETGWRLIRTKSKQRPALVDQRRQPVTDEGLFYAGCWVNAHINAYAWAYGGKRGVSFGLNAVQFAEHGDRIDNRPEITDVFEALEGSDVRGEGAPGDSLFD